MKNHVPILGHGVTREQAMRAEIMQAISSLSLGIYSHLAVAHLAAIDVHQTADRERLKDMAKNAHLAAQAYFEGLGIVEFQK